jgi:LysR family transcriptional regulator, low CO2-responsive transcriptional regulator
MSLNVAHLRAFHNVAREGGFTTAARALGTTQPTVSSQVKALELRYSVRLVDRSARGVSLTPLGKRLFEVTAPLFSLEEEAAELLGGSQVLSTGYLRVGGDGPHHVVPALAEFARRYPAVEVSLEMGNAASVMAALAELRLDVAIVAKPGDSDRFFSKRFSSSPLVLFVAREHAWSARRSVTLEEVVSERLILRERGSQTRSTFESALADADLHAHSVLEIYSREAVREAVAANLGVGVVAQSELDKDNRVRPIRLRDSSLHITEYLVCLHERRRLGAVSAFVDIASEQAT